MKLDDDFYLRLDDHIRCIFNRIIPWVVVFITIALLNVAAQASERDHGDTQNPFTAAHFHKNLRGEDIAKGIAVGVIATCGFKLFVARVNEKRWTWCGGGERQAAREAGDYSTKTEMADIVNRLRDERITPSNLSDYPLAVTP